MKLLPEKVGGENISIFLIQLSQAPQLLHPLQVRREPHVAQVSRNSPVRKVIGSSKSDPSAGRSLYCGILP